MSETDWTCWVCTAENHEAAVVCRVCRASPDEGDTPSRAPEDLAPRLPWWRVYPMLGAIAFVGFFFADLSPAHTSWAAGTTGVGRLAAAGSTRAAVLRAAAADLVSLADELHSSVVRDQAVSSTWISRLAYARVRWQLYGDVERYAGLQVQETTLASAVEQLSSLGFLAAQRPVDPHVGADINALINELQRIGESLADAP